MSTKITLPIEIEDHNDPKARKTLAFTLADTCVSVSSDGEDVGEVITAIGGQVRVRIHEGKTDKVVKISPRDIWNACCEIIDRSDLTILEREESDESN